MADPCFLSRGARAGFRVSCVDFGTAFFFAAHQSHDSCGFCFDAAGGGGEIQSLSQIEPIVALPVVTKSARAARLEIVLSLN